MNRTNTNRLPLLAAMVAVATDAFNATRNFVDSKKSSILPLGAFAAVATGNAHAQASFDATTVTAAIAIMLAAAVIIWTAWSAARWTIKAFGVITGNK